MSKMLPRWLARSLFATTALCCLAVMAPASAGIIGSFDPAFGPNIPNLGFRGTITLDVSAGCFAEGVGGFAVLNDGTNCIVTVQSAQILFYNFAAGTPNTVLFTKDLAGSFFSPNYVESMSFDANDHFVGMNTQDSDQFAVAVSDGSPNPPISYSGNMLLFFSDPGSIFDPAFLVNCSATPPPPRLNVDAVIVPNCDTGVVSNAATVTFTETPEPDSIALASLGLGALIVSRRRRRAAVVR